ncbi:MAG: alcohol dehydrogenase catalytic domain-containing protein [Caldilineales bacterium]|nr:alcohol dehydrogenase catalytic domain-containing protein [Caldilineales bacterium]
MLAAVLTELNHISLQEVPTPTVDDDSALMRVEATSICGSDIRIYRHGNPRVKPPAILGHEASGTIVAVGKNVTRVKVGDRVALGADFPCGECKWCRNGLLNNCKVNYAVGYQIPGAFAEYMLLPKLLLQGPVTPIPDSLSFEEAALAEPLACAINGFELVNLSLGKSVVIIGLGPIGCMMIDLARIMGATKVIGVQRSKLRMEIAKTYGADVYIDPNEEDVVARCREETGGDGPDIVITAAGSVESHEQAIEMVGQRGYVNLFGGLAKNARPMCIQSNIIHYKECFVTGSHGSTPRHHELAVDLLAKGLVRVKPLMTHRFPLSQINAAFDAMEGRAGMKIMLQHHEA